MVEPERSDIDELIDEFEESDEEISNEFAIRDPLDAPSANLVTTQTLHSTCRNLVEFDISVDKSPALIHEGVIDLNPPYQRGEFHYPLH